MSDASEWERRVGRHFAFLTDHEYGSPTVDDSSWWQTTAIYRSKVNAVLVKRSVEFHRVEIELVRLTDDENIPPIDVWVGPASDGHALLDNVVEVRAPALLPKQLGGTSAKRADRALEIWARLLREVAPDFLAGSNECIDEAHGLVLDRVRKHPQILTIKLPSTATQDEQDAAVAHARAVAPKYVAIKVQRYRHQGVSG